MQDMPLTPADIKAGLVELSGWTHEADGLEKTFNFGSFRESMSFMMRVAFEAEDLDHHPEWTNVYDRVSIRLTTHHSDNKVTAKDLELARRIERINWVK